MSTNRFKKVDMRTLDLINGYVKNLDIHNQVIPSTIIQLLVNFYYYFTNYLYSSYQPPVIYVAELDKNKNYKCNVKLLDKSMADIFFYGKFTLWYLLCQRFCITTKYNTTKRKFG